MTLDVLNTIITDCIISWFQERAVFTVLTLSAPTREKVTALVGQLQPFCSRFWTTRYGTSELNKNKPRLTFGQPVL